MFVSQHFTKYKFIVDCYFFFLYCAHSFVRSKDEFKDTSLIHLNDEWLCMIFVIMNGVYFDQSYVEIWVS
jgi:hypothetical protein